MIDAVALDRVAVRARKAKLPDARYQFRVGGLLDGLLVLPAHHHAQGIVMAEDRQGAGDLQGFRTASPAVYNFIVIRHLAGKGRLVQARRPRVGSYCAIRHCGIIREMARRNIMQRALVRFGNTLQRWGGGRGGRLTSGGIVNFGTGMGTGNDKTEQSFFTPTRFWAKSPLEILYVQSHAARRAIRLPIDDMFIRWRRFISDQESIVEQFEEAETKSKARIALREAMVAAGVYGSGLVVILTKESKMEEPLNVDRIREGDLANLLYIDRYEASYGGWDRDIFSPNYGNPVWYNIHPNAGIGGRAHYSRVIRFDGIRPPSQSGFLNFYDQLWGVSEYVPIITSLLQDASAAAAIAHMTQEASIPVLSIQGLRDAIAGRQGPGEATPEQIGEAINRYKSVYNMLMLEGGGMEEFNRVAIQFSGLAEIMDKFSERIAAARDIPLTRWRGMSPAGLNATGESDMKNYVTMLESKRALLLDNNLYKLDKVIARNVGMREPPDWEWVSLLDMSEGEQATVAKTKAEALTLALTAGAIDEDEYRAAIDGDDIFGALPGDAPEPPMPELLPMPGAPGGKPVPVNGKKPPAKSPPANGKPAP